MGRDLAPLEPFMRRGRKGYGITRASGKAFATAFRRALLKSHGEQCAYCGAPLAFNSFHVDHVLPKSKGGAARVENLVAACESCNSGKQHRDLEAFRWILSVRFSDLAGIITPLQAEKLRDLGVALPVQPWRFYFEEYLEAMA